MKYKNLQEKIENINLDNLSEDDVLQIETTIKELDNGNIRVVNNITTNICFYFIQ